MASQDSHLGFLSLRTVMTLSVCFQLSIKYLLSVGLNCVRYSKKQRDTPISLTSLTLGCMPLIFVDALMWQAKERAEEWSWADWRSL